jgi:ATP-dependent Clp protease ATP-binding subunit ClpA
MTRAGRQFLIEKGSSEEFGARELKRTLHRMLFHPLAAMMADGDIPPRATVRIDAGKDRKALKFRVRQPMMQVLLPTG